jgi:UDP-galactose transporter B1
MARSKPAASPKHTPSATHKQANGVVHHLDDAVHSLEKRVEEQVELLARDPVEQHEAGLMQLVICVGGIYASL